jgi:16S rRNA processing protein RimM
MTKSDDQSRLLIAEIGAPVGLKGEVRLRSHAESGDSLLALSPLLNAAGEKFQLTRIRPQKNIFVAKFKNINSRTEAEKLTNLRLFVARDHLPSETEDDDYYHVDLIGCEVVDTSGQSQGKVLAVLNFGAGDIIEFGQSTRTSELLSFTADCFPEIDISARRIVVQFPPSVTASAQDASEDEQVTDDEDHS